MTGTAPEMGLRVVIARCLGRGDLMILVDYTFGVMLRGTDVERVAGLPSYAEHARVGDGIMTWRDEAFYPIDLATRLAMEQAGGEAARTFLGWLDVELPAYLTPETLQQARRQVSHLISFTIDATARELTRDPGLRMTRADLFAYLDRCGWVDRRGDEWAPTAHALDHQYVTTHLEPHPDPARPRHSLYERIYVTPAGLDRLRASLRAEAPVLSPPLPSLFD